MIKKGNLNKLLLAIFLITVLLFAFSDKVYASEYGEGEYCLNLNVGYEDDFTSENVKSITVNTSPWALGTDVFNANIIDHKLWTIVVVATKNGEAYPFVSTPGGLVVDDPNDPNYPGYGTYKAIPNPDNQDEFIFTITLKDTWSNKGTTEPKTCGGYGITIKSGPPIENEPEEITSNVNITIIGDELEYHYVADKPNEADVTYFKFDINGGTEDERLVPFTFGNANYTYNDNEPPKNVSQVTTKEAIPYKYMYNGNGKVEFCVNGGGTDEYTSILINDVEYSSFAPHTKEDYWKTLDGGAQMFCIKDVPYSDTYNVVVEGRQTADENKIPGFGWSYLTKERSTDITEEGNFAHGRLVFVSASLEIDGELETFASASSFDNYRYKGKGQIFQWRDGNKEYSEEDRRMAWGNAQMPYGTKIRVRIVPDEGYQLTGLTVSENGFLPTETPGEYELVLTKTNLSYNNDQNQFDLNPKFEKVDATATSKSTTVPNVVLTINKGENAFETGTPKLEVADVASMSPERENEFDKAVNEGFTINNYLEISLYNTIYKGGKKTGNELDSWDTEIHELQNKATIGLLLDDTLAGDEVEVIHEVRDNDNKIVGYDVLEAEYDKKTNTITFETDGFSTYAIAVKKTNEQNEEVTVEFDSRGGTQLQPIKLHKGDKLEKPQDPENGKRKFEGWFIDEALHDEYDFNEVVNNDLILYAKWSDDEENHGDIKDASYTITDKNGNEISFNEFPDKKFNLTVLDYLKLTPKELEKLTGGQVSQQEYDAMVNEIKNKVKDKGVLLAFYEVLVTGKNDENEDYNVDQGTFTIKIKVTDELKKYNNYYLTYIDIDENNKITKGETIKLALSSDGKYLVGTLPHLSKWTLTGSNSLNPQTGDNIMNYVAMLGVSILGLISSGIYLRKREN